MYRLVTDDDAPCCKQFLNHMQGKREVDEAGDHELSVQQVRGDREGVAAVGGRRTEASARDRPDPSARISRSTLPRLTWHPSARKAACRRGLP